MTISPAVLLAGLFSAKDRDYADRLDELAARVEVLGGRVVGRFVQRRGVSHGGVRLMGRPLSRRFVVGPGKVREIAAACVDRDVDGVVFANELDAYRRRRLYEALGTPVLAAADLAGDLPLAHLLRTAEGEAAQRKRRSG
ncbi:HflX-like GTP-binding protein [Hamadaea tsunoensis]|uniref:HflX-like GTP-binding protein n=1 Tax=Hamadaea tsunoensis TaxID=53368 RepID=UPI0003FA035E|nr:hypothetical protein [Hamadaea tsunoensis]